MQSVLYVGIDVHKDSYSSCCLQLSQEEEDRYFGMIRIEADSRRFVQYLTKLQQSLGDVEFICAYEAGCMGYSLYHQLTARGINCVILAPTTMHRGSKTAVKTDKRDAKLIAQNLAYGTARTVHIPTAEDDMVKQYIRMRGGYVYTGRTNWTKVHLQWLRQLELDWLLRETLDDYLATYEQLTDKLAAFDRRIEELAASERYSEQVKKLVCFSGIRTYSALSILVETGDFERFPTAEKYAAYLGLVPGEQSSGEKRNGTGITKTGNRHLRKTLTEASQAICRGTIGHKSRALRERQAGSSSLSP